MKRIILLSIVSLTSFFVNAQETPLECMHGVWTVYYDDSNQKGFSLRKGHNVVSISYIEGSSSYKPSVTELIIGFLDYDPNVAGKVNYTDLKPEGSYYVEFYTDELSQDSVFTSSYFTTPSYEGCDSEGLYIQARHMIEYGRLERLPSKAIRYLYEAGKEREHNYISEYLDTKAAQVKVDKCVIYSAPEVPTKMFMISGDVPTILEEKGDWLRFEFLGTRLVTGWIKKADVAF
ncbi:hypothetical protein N6H18_06830 [Reichenbachiella agarivorans]|uniref:SH3 domain-containing protein n=1 Tax=Reichenbachiella agarivorans TaxID=2979464 RepID=A0ABY6CT19_9BACT|nr:hypothetical protein [Reichenbachiella agarivorans]UXP33666.1 hypothetical protein N6H18_06830 [Reichenbachiella agarivorans]